MGVNIYSGVLVAEKDPSARDVLGRMLRDAGYEVLAEATDGLEAVEKTYSLLPLSTPESWMCSQGTLSCFSGCSQVSMV